MEITKLEGFHPYYKMYVVDEINSTNTFLKNEYKIYDDNTVLYALAQTGGRGRYHRAWNSNEAVCFSILAKHQAHDAVIAPLAICLALADFDYEVGIKWPNDVYYEGKKLAGILIEDVFMPSYEASVIGIGINLADKPEVNGIGLNNSKIDPLKLISKILDYYYILNKKPIDTLIAYYRSYSIVVNKNIVYKDKEYLVLGIDNKGYLEIQNGEDIIHISSDEINIKEALIKND